MVTRRSCGVPARRSKRSALSRLRVPLAVRNGCGEVLGLRWADIDLGAGALRIRQLNELLGGTK
jgi:integrase